MHRVNTKEHRKNNLMKSEKQEQKETVYNKIENIKLNKKFGIEEFNK